MQHENQRIESVSRFFCESAKLLGLLVDLIGIEPMTSSMPWKIQLAGYRRQGTYETAQPAKPAQSARFDAKLTPTTYHLGQG